MRRDAGFTLMEVLVATAVFGFVILGLVSATKFGINAWNVQDRMVERADELERVERVLRNVVEQATPPLSADDKPFSGLEHRLDFITRLPPEPQTDPIRRVEVVIGVDDQHRLMLRWQYKPNATSLKTLPPPNDVVLAKGVDHLDVQYRQQQSDGGKWQSRWDDSNLPSLVLMHIVMTDKNRQWPVIQAATMLDTNGSF